MNEGDEAYTTNQCQKCFNNHLQAKGEEPLTNVQWRQVVEEKAYRGRRWKLMGKEPYLRGMWEHFSCERSKAKKFRQLADEEKQVSGSRNRLQRIYDEERLHRLEKWNVGRIKRNLEGKVESLRMGLRQDERGLRFGGIGRDRKKRALCMNSCSRALTICGESLRPSEDKVESQCRTCARKTTFGVSGERPQVVVRNLCRKVRLETTEQAVGRANW